MSAIQTLIETDKDAAELFNEDSKEYLQLLDEAAADLASLRAQVARLERIETVARDLNEWLIRSGLGDTAHQRELAAALMERTDKK